MSTLPPPGSEQIAAWARYRGHPYAAVPAEHELRSWEPFWVLVSPLRYYNAIWVKTGQVAATLVEPWCAAEGAEPLGRSLLAFVAHPGLRYRAAARVGATFMTRVAFLGEAPPREQRLGDVVWDAKATSFGATPEDAARGLSPSLRRLLLGWGFEGHIELRPGGLLLHLADAEPRPGDYERLLAWLPMVLEKALKQGAPG